MGVLYPDYPNYDHRDPWSYKSAPKPSPLRNKSRDTETLPMRPEPTATRESRGADRRRERRRSRPELSSRKTGRRCENDQCVNPTLPDGEKLGTGPYGMMLCRRCYKRFKAERRRAAEEQRPFNDRWKKPRRRRSLEKTTTRESEREAPLAEEGPISPMPETISPMPTATPSTFASPTPHGEAQPPQDYFEPREEPLMPTPPAEGRNEPMKSPSGSLPYSEKSASLTDSYFEDVERGDRSRSPRKHRRDDRRRSRREDRERRHRRQPSSYDEAMYYKYGRMEEDDDDNYEPRCSCCCGAWSRRRKCWVISGLIFSLILLIVFIAVGVTLSHRYTYTPSTAQVNNTAAFTSGGATRKSVNDTSDGSGAGQDVYTYYHGPASNFPPSERWIDFDAMWKANLNTFQNSCGWLNEGPNNTPEMIQDIYDAIQNRANASLVDHRFILATILQESNGCVRVGSTTSSGGVHNPGLMQSHNGHAYDSKHSRKSIFNMVQDGTQGTKDGAGLVQNLNTYGNPYKAMRGYNSGYIPASGDLSEKAGATACYVTDIANRLTGWVNAKSKCPGDTTNSGG